MLIMQIVQHSTASLQDFIKALPILAVFLMLFLSKSQSKSVNQIAEVSLKNYILYKQVN